MSRMTSALSDKTDKRLFAKSSAPPRTFIYTQVCVCVIVYMVP